ncbi:MAG: MauE/DoxX family redox-associated membrane protein [Planctomycetota bacterium]|nr:MauE/DoxX family redox-associated membrane protein [Planctomycetota bacterium]
MTTENNPSPRPSDQLRAGGTIGMILIRIVVPLWVLSGALFKITERSPSLLPKDFMVQVEALGVDLYWALAILIAFEFVAVAIMLFIPSLARLMAVFMLSAFCLVLLNELRAGNFDSCGCLGSASPPPWLMLIIDFLLLLGVVVFKPRPVQFASKRTAWTIVAVLVLITSGTTFTLVLGEMGSTTIVEVEDPQSNADGPADAGDASDPGTEPSTRTLPGYYLLDTSDWVGRNVRDIDLVNYVDGLADSVQDGRQYVIFFSRTCDHCQMLLELHYGFGVPVPTTLVSIPENKDGFETEGLLDQPCLDCRELELPVGCEWLMTPPLVLALENGVVQCAKEAEDSDVPECLIWH